MVESTSQPVTTTLIDPNQDFRSAYGAERIDECQVFLMRHAKSSLNESMTDFRSKRKIDANEDMVEKDVANVYLDLIFDQRSRDAKLSV